MSDVQGGPDWWLGEDDRWYPPVKKASTSNPNADDSVGDSVEELADKQVPYSKRRAIAGVTVIIVLILGVLLVRQLTKTEYRYVSGTFSLTDNYNVNGFSTDENCNTFRGYSDLNSSTQIVVTNSDGKELARTSFGNSPIRTSENGRKCTWYFTLEIPKGEKYYVVTIGERGQIQKTFDELLETGIQVGISEND